MIIKDIFRALFKPISRLHACPFFRRACRGNTVGAFFWSSLCSV
nr:MAG TPA: hypothetical protein [Caudoviricetes sp.]